MFKKFKTVGGVKFYAKDDGTLANNEQGEPVAVPADAAEGLEEVAATGEGEAVDEVAKMIAVATKKAMASGAKSFDEAVASATKAVNDLLAGVVRAAAPVAQPHAPVTKATLNIDEVVAGLAEVRTNKRSMLSFEIRNAEDLKVLAKSTGMGDLTDITPEAVVNVDRAPVRAAFVEQIADTAPTDVDSVPYIEVTTETGAPATTAELAAIPPKDFVFAGKRATVTKVAVLNKHSVEILADRPQLVAAIKGWLATDLNLAVDAALLSGTGVGDELPGILTKAAAFTAIQVGTKRIANANLFDVIRIMLTYVAKTGKGKFVPSHIVLNPADADELDLTKDVQGRYVLPPFMSSDGQTIKGVRVIENAGMTEGSVLVGDFKKYHVATKGGVEIEITNSDADDFAHDIITVKLRRRLAAYLRVNDNGAIVLADISDIKAALVAA